MQHKLSITNNKITVDYIFSEEEKSFFIQGAEEDHIKFKVSPKNEDEKMRNDKWIPMCHLLEQLGMLHEKLGFSHSTFEITEEGQNLYEKWKANSELPVKD